MVEIKYQKLIDTAILELFWDALKVTICKPKQVFFVLRMAKIQRRSTKKRAAWEKQDIQVPPFAIYSVTDRCNLHCKGCYAQVHHPIMSSGKELPAEKLHTTLQEAQELGISIILIAGGEPLVRKDLLAVLGEFPDIVFPLFTNGILIDEATLRILKNRRNIIPIVSLEGFEKETDERRGSGVYEKVHQIFKNMHRQGLFYGTSLTVTRENFTMITDDQFIQELITLGCRIFFYVEYIPVREGTEALVVTEEQRKDLIRFMEEFRRKYPGLFIAFPGDEEKFGGCLAAGRGFIHINAQGSIEPCPFSPFSDVDLAKLTLKDALKSPLLKTIREHADQLKETQGGCALWENREWVKSLIEMQNSSKEL